MTTQISRRRFLHDVTAAGGVLCIGVSLSPGCASPLRTGRKQAQARGELIANAYISVLRSGRVVLSVHKTEMGQGVTTGYVTMVAEELEVEPSDVDFVFADAADEFRGNNPAGAPLFALQNTGSSTSTREGFVVIRRAAAAAREMLISAAAARWDVDTKVCSARQGLVTHGGSRRSVAYGELTVEAAMMSVPEDPPLKRVDEFRVIGRSLRRVDARAKVTGRALYATDFKIDRMLCAVMLHPSRIGASPKSIDSAAALEMPGVVDVVALEHGVAIVAEKRWQALNASKAVTVKWGPSPIDGLNSRDVQQSSRAFRGEARRVRDDGDVDSELSSADSELVEAVYEFPYLNHATMEPMSAIASVTDGRVEVWSGGQSQTAIQDHLADELGVSSKNVVVHTLFAGGGFGRRGVTDFALEAARISKHVGRPIQLLWSRESDMQRGYYRPAAVSRLKGALRGGRPTALCVHSLSQPIAPHQRPFLRGALPRSFGRQVRGIIANSNVAAFQGTTLPDLFGLEGAHDFPYSIANARAEFTPIQSALPVGFWRSVGHSYNPFTIECFVDEMADRVGADPYRFRRRLLTDGSRERRVLDAVAEISRWDESAEPGFAKGLARHTSFGSEVAQVAEVGVVDDMITVRRVFCVIDCGLAINPDVVKAQMEGSIIFGLSAALQEQIEIRDGEVQQSNFHNYPVLRMHQAPEIHVRILEGEPEPEGVGEPGLPPIGPAVANGLYRATGVRLRSLPLQPAWERREIET
ncbi:MAG: molybdopterin cofactor-binding domain-containing protein [Myxococcota bacterium]